MLPKATYDEISRKIEMVSEAKDHLLDAIRLLKKARLGANTEAYVIDQLEVVASADHDFLSLDKNLDDVLEELMEQAAEVEAEEEEETEEVAR